MAGCIRPRHALRRHLLPSSWPGTGRTTRQDAKYHPSPVKFTSPCSTATRTTTGSHSRPTCRGSRRPTSAASATARPERTASTRRRARLLPDLLHRDRQPPTQRRASGSSAAPPTGHDRTRSAGTRPPSTARCSPAPTQARALHPPPRQQLPQHPRQKPLPGERLNDTSLTNGRRPSGASRHPPNDPTPPTDVVAFPTRLASQPMRAIRGPLLHLVGLLLKTRETHQRAPGLLAARRQGVCSDPSGLGSPPCPVICTPSCRG